MRAGTHLMIDSLLNNFDSLRATPLYVNLDRMLESPNSSELIASLAGSGGYVIKTHYPQFLKHRRDDYEQLIRQVAEKARIITVARDPSETFRSTRSWLASNEASANPINLKQLESANDWSNYESAVAEFNTFWSQFPLLSIDYRRLINPAEFPSIISSISEWIELPHRSRIIPPPPKRAKMRVYVAKAMTRLLGNKAPTINTTIRFAK
jgi:hypothetical protein